MAVSSVTTSNVAVITLADVNEAETVELRVPLAPDISQVDPTTTDTMVTAVFQAATATVSGGGTLVKTKSDLDVGKFVEYKHEYTQTTVFTQE